MPKISIVIPTYNAEKYIKRCINSLLQQTLDDIEIVCVDDCSSDGTMQILSKYAKKDKRIKVLSLNENRGTLMARKAGVMKASGEYIMFSDNDDWYENDACEKLYDKAIEKNADILMYSIHKVSVSQDEKDDTKEQIIDRGYGRAKAENVEKEHCIPVENRMNWLWNKIVRASVCKKAYEATDDIYLTVAEDTYACWLIHYYAKNFVAIDEVYYNWNITTGVSNKFMDIPSFDKFCKCMSDYEKAMYSFFDKVNAPEYVREAYENDTEPKSSYCVNKWRMSLSEEDAAEGMKILLKYYNPNRISTDIHHRWNKMENDRQEKIKGLRNEIKKIRSSKRYKAITKFATLLRGK